MELLSKAVDGVGVAVWAIDDSRSGGDILYVQMYYQDHRQAESSEPKQCTFELELGSDYDDDDEYWEYVWDTVREFLDNFGVELSMHPATMEAIEDCLVELLERHMCDDSIVLVVSIVAGGSPEAAVKAVLAASGVLSLTRAGGGCCAICLDDVATCDGDEVEVCRLTCSHEFHVDCLVEWMINCVNNSPFCPLCRSALKLVRFFVTST